MKKILILLLLGLSILSISAQSCTPATPVVVAAPVAASTIATLINSNGEKAIKTQAEWDSQRTMLANCNASVSAQLRQIEDKMAELSLRRQEILAVKDVANLQKQLTELQQSRDASREELRKNLAQIKMAGLYVVVLSDINILAPKPDHIRLAEEAIAPMAARELGGTHIQRETRVENLANVKDIIRSFSGGSMVIGEILKDQAMNASKRFVYAAKVYVSPAKITPQTAGGQENSARVIAISSNNTSEMALSTLGLPQTTVDDLTSVLSAKIPAMESENAAAMKKSRDIAAAGETKIAAITQQITDIERQIAVANKQLSEVLVSFGYTFDAKDLAGSIGRATAAMSAKATELGKQWLDTKSKEIIWKESTVLPEGAPADAIGKTATDLATQMDKTYGRITTNVEVIEIINLSVSGYKEGRSIAVFRAIERVWVMAIAQDDGTFRVIAIGKCNVKSKMDGTTATEESIAVSPTLPRKTYTVNGVNFTLVKVPGGSFTMGSTSGEADEKPLHQVNLTSYWVLESEVTQALYRAVMGENPSSWKGDNLPVEQVSWTDTQLFIRKLNDEMRRQGESRRFRLPTEAEWEYAAKGGENYLYAGSNILDRVAWYESNSGARTHEVKTKAPNAYGLYDMTGNVWEWCNDWYSAYSAATEDSPIGANSGEGHVNRGGSWINAPVYCRLTDRGSTTPPTRFSYLGFRFVAFL